MYCQECRRRFKTEQAYQQHVSNSPKHAANFACDQCNRTFRNERSLEQHCRDSPAHVTADENPLNSPPTASSSSVSEGGGQVQSWSMRPNLHDQVMHCLEDVDLTFDFYNIDEPEHSVREHDTNVMGRFTCRNASCPTNGWSSKKIFITIRMYARTRYNARVYHQRCAGCDYLSWPDLDEAAYVERLAYRLKKWSGIEMDEPPYSGTSRGPHLSDLCEGCRLGRCSQLG